MQVVVIDHCHYGKFSQLYTGMFYFGSYKSTLHQSEPCTPAETRMNDLILFSYCGLHVKGRDI